MNRWLLWVLCLLLVAYVAFMSTPSSNARLALKWCRLAPLPSSSKVILVEKTGSIFTRGYRVKFSADAKVIDRWKSQSPGLNDAIYAPPTKTKKVIEIGTNGGTVDYPHDTERYIIYPIKGINSGDVYINTSHTMVEIVTYKD